MRRLLMVLLMLGVAGMAMASVTGNVYNPKDPGVPYVNPNVRPVGDTIGDPFTILLGAAAAGTTVGFNNDYDASCPYTGGTAPDAVYKYDHIDPLVAAIAIDLCYSSYDTKLFVYDSTNLTTPIACNDDYYTAAPCYGYSSFLPSVPVIVGHTYYIVVDGYASSSGAYYLGVQNAALPVPSYPLPPPPVLGACCAPSGACTMTTMSACAGSFQGENTDCAVVVCPQPPPVICPNGALLEGEVCTPTSDHYNGGCNSVPNIWQTINPQSAGCATMCGTSCAVSSYRDTDWFEVWGTGGTMTVSCTAAFPLQLLFIYGTDCAAPSYDAAVVDAGVPATLSRTIGAGVKAWIWIGASAFGNFPEANYVLDICGFQAAPLPPGACCNSNGGCIVTTPENCAFMNGIFQGDPVCTPNTCIIPTGACCNFATGACTVTTHTLCGFDWLGANIACTPVTCPIPSPTEIKSWGAVKHLYR